MHAIEPDGADFEVISDDEVKVCNTTKGCVPAMTKAKPAFRSYYDIKLIPLMFGF